MPKVEEYAPKEKEQDSGIPQIVDMNSIRRIPTLEHENKKSQVVRVEAIDLEDMWAGRFWNKLYLVN